MKPRLRPVIFLFAAVALLTTWIGHATAAESSAKKPVLLYSRYFNAIGETRYQPDGTYKEVLNRLRNEFDVRVHNEPLNAKTLADVTVVVIANPGDQAAGTNPPPHHVNTEDINAIQQYVEGGGGLIVMGNQENHNLETEDINKLLIRFGLQFKNDYTDAKKISLSKETPIIGGLTWAYFTGNSVQITVGHSANPRALIMNDLTEKPLNGPRNAPGPLLATSEPGKGRVAVITDAGWLNADALMEKGVGGVVIKGHDNWEICRRLMHWAAGK